MDNIVSGSALLKAAIPDEVPKLLSTAKTAILEEATGKTTRELHQSIDAGSRRGVRRIKDALNALGRVVSDPAGTDVDHQGAKPSAWQVRVKTVCIAAGTAIVVGGMLTTDAGMGYLDRALSTDIASNLPSQSGIRDVCVERVPGALVQMLRKVHASGSGAAPVRTICEDVSASVHESIATKNFVSRLSINAMQERAMLAQPRHAELLRTMVADHFANRLYMAKEGQIHHIDSITAELRQAPSAAGLLPFGAAIDALYRDSGDLDIHSKSMDELRDAAYERASKLDISALQARFRDAQFIQWSLINAAAREAGQPRHAAVVDALISSGVSIGDKAADATLEMGVDQLKGYLKIVYRSDPDLAVEVERSAEAAMTLVERPEEQRSTILTATATATQQQGL